MAEKMRAMQHNSRANSKGRVHGSKHNDRNFDTSRADNINQDKVSENDYWHIYMGDPDLMELTFEEAELRFYVEVFGEQLQKTNDNYLRHGHPERCKDMAAWKMARQNAPEETVMQIGKMEDHADALSLRFCYDVYTRRLSEWSESHGNPFTELNYAIHVDEAVPHVQSRRVWHYMDENGMMKIGQEKALEKAGVELPKPDKPVSRTNNRKMTFDKMTRALWLEVLRDHGFEIEEKALPNGKHNREKEDMIRDKYQGMITATAQLKKEREDLTAQIQVMQQQRDELAGQTSQLQNLQRQMEQAKADAEAAERRKKATEEQITALERKKAGLMTSMEVANLEGRKTLTGGLKDVTYTEFEALKRTAAKVESMEADRDRAIADAKSARQEADDARMDARRAERKAQQELDKHINWFNAKQRGMDEEIEAKSDQKAKAITFELNKKYTDLLKENSRLHNRVKRLETAIEYLKAVIKEWLPDHLKMVEARVKKLLSRNSGDIGDTF